MAHGRAPPVAASLDALSSRCSSPSADATTTRSQRRRIPEHRRTVPGRRSPSAWLVAARLAAHRLDVRTGCLALADRRGRRHAVAPVRLRRRDGAGVRHRRHPLPRRSRSSDGGRSGRCCRTVDLARHARSPPDRPRSRRIRSAHACCRRPRPCDQPRGSERHDGQAVVVQGTQGARLLLPEGRHARVHDAGVRAPRHRRPTSATP